MSVSFMVLGAPRSGTTWAANWLTTDTTLCLHDPLGHFHYTELDSIDVGRKLGVSCTALGLFPEWVNAHKAPKIVLRRDSVEVNASLARIGLPSNKRWEDVLDRIDGLHLHWTTLFNDPKRICKHFQLPFDQERYALLNEMKIQPYLGKMELNTALVYRLMNELESKGERLCR